MEIINGSNVVLTTLDILREILVLITEKDAWSVRLINKKILRAVSRIRRKNAYWKYRCEIVLNINMSDVKTGDYKWKYLYKLIIRKGFNSALCNYCFRGLISPVKLLLSDSRINPSNNNCEALRTAFDRRHLQIMKIILLNSKTQPTRCDLLINTVCRYVISNCRCCEFVKILLQDSRYDIIYNDNLLLSLNSDTDPEIYQLLLNHPKINPSDRRNAAIICASSNRNTSDGVVELLLLDSRVNPADRNNYAIIACAKNGKTRNLKLLLEDPRIDPTVKNNKAFIKACKTGPYDNVKLLYNDPRINPSDNNNKAIINASKSNRIDIVKLLLSDRRVDPSDQHNLAIITASKYGYVDVVNILLSDYRVNPSDQNNEAFHAMCTYGTHYPNIDKILKMLLDHPLVRLTLQDFKNFLVSHHMARHEIRSVLLPHPKYSPYKIELGYLIR